MPIQQIKASFAYLAPHSGLIAHLSPLQGHEWEGKLPGKRRGSRTQRDAIKQYIKTQLENIQGTHCAYCGLALYRTSAPQIDHIAPKRIHVVFLFEPQNLALACSLCNGFNKKGEHDTIANRNAIYDRCTFNIVHPYFDDPNTHYTFLTYKGYPCLIQLNTPEAINSNTIFQLDSNEMTEERYKEALNEANPLPHNLETMIEQVRNRVYTST